MTQLDLFELTLQPGWSQSEDSPSSNYQAIWIYPQSPSTPYRSPDSLKQVSRYLLLDPRTKCADGNTGSDEWWFIIERMWPTNYPANNHGKWGRECNFHNVAGDSGPNGGVGWGFGEGTSSMALDWLPGKPSPTFTVHQDGRTRDRALPVPKRDEMQTYLVHFIAGRTDGTTPRAGMVEVWVNGQLVIQEKNINSVQRAQGPDGNWYVQKWMTLWEGDYTSALAVASTLRLVLTRIGKTVQEAIADQPTRKSDSAGRQVKLSGNAPAPTLKVIGQYDTKSSRLPDFAGGQPVPPEEPVETIRVSGEPVVGKLLTFSVVNAQEGAKYGWDRNLDNQADGEGLEYKYAYSSIGEKTIQLLKNGVPAARKTVIIAQAQPEEPKIVLSKAGEGDGWIEFRWDAVPNAVGYRFTREKAAGKWSHTWDGKRTTVKFSNDSAWYRVEAIASLLAGDYRPAI